MRPLEGIRKKRKKLKFVVRLRGNVTFKTKHVEVTVSLGDGNVPEKNG